MSDRRPFVMIPLDIMARTDISSNAKMVYGVLAYRAGSKLIAWPSIPTISADAGTSGSSIRRGIRELVKTGIVIKHQSAGRNSNRYAIQPCQPEQVQPCQPGAQPWQPGAQPYQPGAQPCQPGAQPCQPDPRTIKEQEQEREQEPAPPWAAAEPYHRGNGSKPRRKLRASKLSEWDICCSAMSGPALNTDAFKTIWMEWVDHRREIKKPLTPTSIKRTTKMLERFGHDRAIESIGNSISNGWQGLFMPDAGRSDDSPPRLTVDELNRITGDD